MSGVQDKADAGHQSPSKQLGKHWADAAALVWPVRAPDHSWGLMGQMGSYNGANWGQVQQAWLYMGLGAQGSTQYKVQFSVLK